MMHACLQMRSRIGNSRTNTIRFEGPYTRCHDLEVEQSADALPLDALWVHSGLGNRYNRYSHTTVFLDSLPKVSRCCNCVTLINVLLHVHPNLFCFSVTWTFATLRVTEIDPAEVHLGSLSQ